MVRCLCVVVAARKGDWYDEIWFIVLIIIVILLIIALMLVYVGTRKKGARYPGEFYSDLIFIRDLSSCPVWRYGINLMCCEISQLTCAIFLNTRR